MQGIVQGSKPIGLGDALPSHILEGKTASSDAGDITGTMPNRGAINEIISVQGGQVIIPEGYHNGSGKVIANYVELGSPSYSDIDISYRIGVGFGVVANDIDGGTTYTRTITCNQTGEYRISTYIEQRTTWENQQYRLKIKIGGTTVYDSGLETIDPYSNPSGSWTGNISKNQTVSCEYYCSHTYRASEITVLFGYKSCELNPVFS